MLDARILTPTEMAYINATVPTLHDMDPAERCEARAETIRLVAIAISNASFGWSFARPSIREDLVMSAVLAAIEKIDQAAREPERFGKVESWAALLISTARADAQKATVGDRGVSGVTDHDVRKIGRQRKEVAAARRVLGERATAEQIADQVSVQLAARYASPQRSGFTVRPRDVRRIEAGLHL